jgi:nitrogen-specific signal transduction histidine kinase
MEQAVSTGEVPLVELMKDPTLLGKNQESFAKAEEKDLLITHKNIMFSGKDCSMLIFRDVTSQRSLEKVQNQNDMLNHLTATVTHEMMQPLSCVLGFAANILETATNKQTIRQLRLIISSAKLLKC